VPTPTHGASKFDVLVVGAGAGGVTAAALLAKKGYRTLMVEAKERIGGRASTRLIDGFLVNTGAFAIELDGAVAKTYNDIGPSLKLHEIERASTALRFGGRNLNVAEGPFGTLRNVIPIMLVSIARMLPFLRPKKGESTRSWLSKLTRSSTIHGMVDNVLGAMFAARGDDIPANVLLHYFSKDTSFKKIGFPPGGTIEI
jgi:phytoene dehydrogenase-like protein